MPIYLLYITVRFKQQRQRHVTNQQQQHLLLQFKIQNVGLLIKRHVSKANQ